MLQSSDFGPLLQFDTVTSEYSRSKSARVHKSKYTIKRKKTKLYSGQKSLFDPCFLTKQKDTTTFDISAELEIPLDTKLLSIFPNFFCKYCGSTKQEGHIKKEKRNRKNKPIAQQWFCKKYNKKFINDLSPFNWPLWVGYFSSFFLAAGMKLQAIKNGLEMIAWEKGENFNISVNTIHRLLEHILKLIHEFEQGIEQPIKSDMWQMDEMYQRMSIDRSKERFKSKRKAWIITVSAIDSRYLLATYICPRRSYKNSLKALQIARSRAKCNPKVIRCDGLQSHKKAANRLFPNTKVMSKSKKDDFGYISLQERIHKTVRMGALPKKRRFYSINTLRIYTELDRIDYNFIRVNDAAAKTPAQRAGIDFGIRNWRELLYCAVRFNLKNQLIEE
jgi:transposase-like protein